MKYLKLFYVRRTVKGVDSHLLEWKVPQLRLLYYRESGIIHEPFSLEER